jgi:hypothetical protein
MINQNWVFGRAAKLDFATLVPVASGGASISTAEGCASVSDSAGNLLFYTDGISVWDANDVQQIVGSQVLGPLFGDPSSTQSSIIVPDPASSTHYYIFTTDGSSAGSPWNHFNGILLDVTNWSYQTLPSLMTLPDVDGYSPVEKVTAIQHANCIDYWVITMVQRAILSSNTGPGYFRVFSVTASGVSYVGETDSLLNLAQDLGYMKGSPDGRKLAITNGPSADVTIFDFDNSTGVINIPSAVTVQNPQGLAFPSYGLEFSPNSSLLYFGVLASGGNNAGLYQVDLTNAYSTVMVSQYANPQGNLRYAFGALQRAQNDIIYIAKDDEQSLGAILSPNTVGVGCNVNWNQVALAAGTRCYLGLPNLLPNPCEDDCDCGCGCGGDACHEEVDEANADLAESADEKFFTIVATGQPDIPPCAPAEVPAAFTPYFTMKWGDGVNDHFESHDTEIFYIQVHNPYSNICFGDVKILNIQVVPNQLNPDGSNALQIVPAEIVCFEAIGPCETVSRDFVLMIENSLPGPYQITFDYCIGSVVVTGDVGQGTASFDIEVVKS